MQQPYLKLEDELQVELLYLDTLEEFNYCDGRTAGQLSLKEWKAALFHKRAKKVRAFLDAGFENREWVAQQVVRGCTSWPYSFPLDLVEWYLQCRKTTSRSEST